MFYSRHSISHSSLETRYILGYLFLLLAQTMVGVCIVGSKILLVNLSPIFILSIRFIIAFLFLFLLHLISSKEKFYSLQQLNRKDWFFIIAQALCAGALFNILMLLGLNYTSASMAGIITSALPAIVAIFSIIFLKERLTLFTALCILFAILGLIIINAHSFHSGANNHIFGDIIILISLIPEATYYILAKLHKNKLPVFLISSLMNGINIPVFLLIVWFGHYTLLTSLSIHQIALLFTVGIGSALFYVFWFMGCRNIHGAAAGLTTAFMPIATLVIACIFLGEKLAVIQMFGFMLVILSILFNARQTR